MSFPYASYSHSCKLQSYKDGLGLAGLYVNVSATRRSADVPRPLGNKTARKHNPIQRNALNL